MRRERGSNLRRFLRLFALGATHAFLLTLCGCSAAKPVPCQRPPLALLSEIEIPDRGRVRTHGDLVRLVVEDEAAMRRKNAELRALRAYFPKGGEE